MSKELTDKEKESERKKAAIKEEERLDKLIETYFLNSSSQPNTEDEIGLNMGISQPIELDTNKEEPIDSVVEEDEEVFLVHDDGQITSEVKEVDEDRLKEGYGIERQTIVEKAIYNKAIKNIYKKIEEYQNLLDKLSNNDKILELSRLLEKSSHNFLSNIREYRGELNATGFSQYADIPIDTINLHKIETKELRRIVDLEVEKITMKLINGGIE